MEQAFGRVLREARLEVRLSQLNLAVESGLNRSYIESIEAGERCPTICWLAKVAPSLRTRPSELLRRAESLLGWPAF